MQANLPAGWTAEVERGPEWLFISLRAPRASQLYGDELAEGIWELLDQHMVYRVVLEMEHVPRINSHMIGQLVKLHRRVYNHDGMMRLCGLSQVNQDALRLSNLHAHLHHCSNRAAAVMGTGG